MPTKDLYKVLGVSKDASRDDIRRAYRKLARQYHPDANPGDRKAEERFKEVQHAYEILSNPEKRREHDEGPRSYFGDNRGNSSGGFTSTNADFSTLFDNFGDIFGRTARTRTANTRGEDISVSVNLKFRDALRGVTTRVSAPVEEACGDCQGTGAVSGTMPKTCPECGGRGHRGRDQGLFAFSEMCSRCGGEGRIIERPCAKCRGNGRVRRSRQVTVKIPAGARDGMKIRLPGRGSAGRRGGPNGDLFVVTRVGEHPVFKRRDDDFLVDAPISFVEAALGAEIEVPRPDGGAVKLRLPAGTRDGRQFKVSGAGAPKPQRSGGAGEFGDLIVKVRLVVPQKLNRREREILEALADERDEDVREGLFEKARASE